MRRVEALVGPDALREINAERALLHDLVEALEAKDPQGAIERARKLLERVKRLENELGSLRAGDRDALIASLVAGAHDVDGVSLVVAEVAGEDPGGLRDLAQKVRDRLEGAGRAAVVLGTGADGKALIVAAPDHGDRRAWRDGARAPRGRRQQIGGGAGGKPIMAFAGGNGRRAVDRGARRHPRASRGALAGT